MRVKLRHRICLVLSFARGPFLHECFGDMVLQFLVPAEQCELSKGTSHRADTIPLTLGKPLIT